MACDTFQYVFNQLKCIVICRLHLITVGRFIVFQDKVCVKRFLKCMQRLVLGICKRLEAALAVQLSITVKKVIDDVISWIWLMTNAYWRRELMAPPWIILTHLVHTLEEVLFVILREFSNGITRGTKKAIWSTCNMSYNSLLIISPPGFPQDIKWWCVEANNGEWHTYASPGWDKHVLYLILDYHGQCENKELR